MALVSLNVSLEPYDGSQSQKSYNNVRRMLSMEYFHCKKRRNATNITANFEKSRSKISHFRPQKSEKSPAKSWRDWKNIHYSPSSVLLLCLYNLFAHSSCTSMLIVLLLIKSTVYCPAHFILLHILLIFFFNLFFLTYIYEYSLVLSYI